MHVLGEAVGAEAHRVAPRVELRERGVDEQEVRLLDLGASLLGDATFATVTLAWDVTEESEGALGWLATKFDRPIETVHSFSSAFCWRFGPRVRCG